MTAALTAEASPAHPASQAGRICGVTLVGVSTTTAAMALPNVSQGAGTRGSRQAKLLLAQQRLP